MYGKLGLQGAVVAVTMGEGSAQVGMGASLNESDEYGISIDLDYSVVQQPDTYLSIRRNRDMNFAANLTGKASACVPDGDCCDNNDILFMHGPTSSPNMFDQILIDHLESDGYDVTSTQAGLVTMADADDYGLIVISASVNPVQVHPGLRHSTTPILTWEPYIYYDLRMTGPDNQVCFGLMSGTHIDIHCSNHPLTAGCDGLTEVYDITRSLAWGMPTEDAVVAATIPGNDGKATIFGYEVGDELFGGMEAPARRVGFYIGLQSANHMTDKAFDLLSAAAAWAIDCSEDTGSAHFNTFGLQTESTSTTLTAYPNPADDIMYINLGEEVDVERELSIIDNTGRIVKTQTIAPNASATQTIYTSDLPRGVYYLQINQNEAAPQTQRFVVIH